MRFDCSAAAISFLLLAGAMTCASSDPKSGEDPKLHVGQPCTPSQEDDPAFAGFSLSGVYVKLGADECGTGTCIVNHFQGRVSCPLGQPPPVTCAADGPCEIGNCTGGVCHEAGSCQSATASESGDSCCLPGSDTPVSAAVCGQCEPGSHRDAADAVYCSCRCGVADGAPSEKDYWFCQCPSGFECRDLLEYTPPDDSHLSGKYCIKTATAFSTGSTCGSVTGYADGSQCDGVAP
jgi:hypothetical protein